MRRFAIRHRKLTKTIYWILSALLFVIAVFLVFSYITPAAKPPYVLGVTFRYPYAADFGLDWKKTYTQMLTDLNVKNVRLPAYWDEIEKQKGHYDFRSLDFEISEAEKANAHVVLVVGRRVPGWPECHEPEWTATMGPEDEQPFIEKEISAIVDRYKNSPALAYWQVENEPFLTKFGKCPAYDVSGDLDSEISLVRRLDPSRQIIVTDAGETSTWLHASAHGDIFGSTLYRKVYADFFKSYVRYHIPYIYFRARETIVHIFHPSKPIINVELQGEPWTTAGIKSTSFQEQAITFPPGALAANLDYAHKAGFSTTYFWGVEYWYWAASVGHPEFLQEAKLIFKQ